MEAVKYKSPLKIIFWSYIRVHLQSAYRENTSIESVWENIDCKYL